MDEWMLCWKVNRVFQVKQNSQQNCVVCGKVEKAGLFLSTFVANAVSCMKGHHWKSNGVICTDCDRDLVLKISRREQTCFEVGCELTLNIKALEGKLKDKDLLNEYLALVEKYRVCTLCYEPLGHLPERTPTIACNHDVDTCNRCMQGYIKSAIDSGGWQEIHCPESSCKQSLSGADIQMFASPDFFERYEELITLKFISSLPNFRWCAGNDRKCGWGQLLSECEMRTRWGCQKCKEANCFECYTLDHDPKTCLQNQRETKVDPATLALLFSTTKGCPNRKCRKRITKEKGCKDMVCRSTAGGCGLTFCWNCKVIYRLGVREHLKNCRFLGGKRVEKPDMEDGLYAEDWDKDPGYVPGPKEYTIFF